MVEAGGGGNGVSDGRKNTRAGSVLTFFRPQPRKKCRTDPDAPPSLTRYEAVKVMTGLVRIANDDGREASCFEGQTREQHIVKAVADQENWSFVGADGGG